MALALARPAFGRARIDDGSCSGARSRTTRRRRRRSVRFRPCLRDAIVRRSSRPRPRSRRQRRGDPLPPTRPCSGRPRPSRTGVPPRRACTAEPETVTRIVPSSSSQRARATAAASAAEPGPDYVCRTHPPRPEAVNIHCWLSSSSPTGRHNYAPPALGGKRGMRGAYRCGYRKYDYCPLRRFRVCGGGGDMKTSSRCVRRTYVFGNVESGVVSIGRSAERNIDSIIFNRHDCDTIKIILIIHDIDEFTPPADLHVFLMNTLSSLLYHSVFIVFFKITSYTISIELETYACKVGGRFASTSKLIFHCSVR